MNRFREGVMNNGCVLDLGARYDELFVCVEVWGGLVAAAGLMRATPCWTRHVSFVTAFEMVQLSLIPI